MAIDLTKRAEKGSPLTISEMDQNLTDIETAVNDLTPTYDSVSMDTSTDEVVDSAGEMAWGSDDGTVLVGVSPNNSIEIGQSLSYYVRNKSGATITKGSAVRATGTLGSSGRITVDLMVADGSVPAKYFLGIVEEDIANSGDGYVSHFGKIRKLDTSAFTDGDILWCDPSVDGGLTPTEPTNGNIKLPVAIVIHAHQSNGVLFIRSTNGFSITSANDSHIAGLSDGEVLVWNASGSYWENGPAPSSLTGITDSTAPFTTSLGENQPTVIGEYNTLFGHSVASASAGITGVNNVLVGVESGNSITSGSYNVYAGHLAGQLNTSASDCVYIGREAGRGAISSWNIAIGTSTLNTGGASAGNTIAIGNRSLRKLTTGDGNVAIGSESGENITTAYHNVLVGHQAGSSITTGNGKNVLVGYQAGTNITTGEQNVAVGSRCLAGATNTATGNIAIGSHAGNIITTGGHNILLGSDVGSSLTTENQNIIIGYISGKSFTGQHSVMIGAQAGQFSGSSASPIFIGYQSGMGDNITTPTGSNPIGIGRNTLKFLTSGNHNIALGSESGENITSGDNNISLGQYALSGDQAGLTGDHNIGIGFATAWLNTTGQNNTFIGNSSGFNNTTGSNNIGIGPYSLNSNDTDKLTGTFNIAIGFKSMYAATTATSNVSIGEQAGDSITTGIKNVVIGHFADTSADASNTVSIGTGVNNTKDLSNAIGYYAESNHRGELAIATGDATKKHQTGYVSWYGTTTNSSATELFLAGGGGNGDRFNVPDNSMSTLNLVVTAYDSTADHGYSINITVGVINNAGTLVANLVEGDTPYHQDVGWGITASTDAGDKALVINATGDATNSVVWTVAGYYTTVKI
jgi:hypothetical protein